MWRGPVLLHSVYINIKGDAAYEPRSLEQYDRFGFLVIHSLDSGMTRAINTGLMLTVTTNWNSSNNWYEHGYYSVVFPDKVLNASGSMTRFFLQRVFIMN